MINIDDANYIKGMEYYTNQNLIQAKNYFQLAMANPQVKDAALDKLAAINMYTGDYQQARNLLESADVLNGKLKQTYGELENIEFNYETSKKYYQESLAYSKTKKSALSALALLDIQMGEYASASKTLQVLQFDKHYNVSAILNLVKLNIMLEKYEEAYNLLQSLDIEQLGKLDLSFYDQLTMILNLKLAKKANLGLSFDLACKRHPYFFKRLNSKNDDDLIRIVKYRIANPKAEYINFLDNVNAKKLIAAAYENIESMNGNYYNVHDMYRFTLPKEIGYKDGITTKDLCVTTIMGTKTILTMYPIILSSEYNKEGLVTSEKLKAKRLNK